MYMSDERAIDTTGERTVDPTFGTDVAPSRWFEHLNDGLPPHIARLKAAGDFERASRLIDEALAAGTTPELAQAMLVEKARMARIPHAYPFTCDQALEMVRREWPEFTRARLDELVDRGRIDWRYVDGEMHLIEDFLDSVRIYHAEAPGLAPNPPQDVAARDAMLDEMREKGHAARKIVLRATLEVADPELDRQIDRARSVQVWLPLPRACEQQSQIEVLSATPGAEIAPEASLARTVHWEGSGLKRCEVTYSYLSCAPWHDVDELIAAERRMGERDLAQALAAPGVSAWLGEQEPHVVFTPYLRSLAERIVGQAGAVRPTEKARAIYEWVTNTIDYRYQPPYFLLDCIPQMAATELRADCGVFALTFITLCRIAGVPARWQSGLYVRPGEASGHDWAQFYSPAAGSWLWADCSFGSAGRRTGDARKHDHYFGNLDPWRMVANGDFFAALTPPVDGMRDDPFDNQRGEMTVDGVGVTSDRLHRPVEVLSMETVD